MRKMCEDCPFNPASKFFYVRERWAAACEADMTKDGVPVDGSLAHGCHNRGDESRTANEETVCIGHRDWLQGARHELEVI